MRSVLALAGAALIASSACGVGPTGPAAAPGCSGVIRTNDPNTSSPARCVMFAGYEWILKSSAEFGPGPNAWSDSVENVRVDASGLQLAITNRSGVWYSAEAVLNESLGYGTYSFWTPNGVYSLDPNVVLGLFIYDYGDPAFAHREIGIEFSPRLGGGGNGHFTVQPADLSGNMHDFVPDAGVFGVRHSIDWRADRVTFQSGSRTWAYTGPSIPRPGAENIRVNLWLHQGRAPVTSAGRTVTIRHFEFRQ